MATVEEVERQSRASAPGRRAGGLARSVQGRLALLTATLVLTAGLAAALLIVDGWRAHRRATEQQLSETTAALSLAVDGKVREIGAVLKALSASPYLDNGDLKGFDRHARRVVDRPGKWVLLFDDQGHRLVSTAGPPGAPLSSTPLDYLKSYRDGVRGREMHISNLYTRTITGKPAVGVAMPLPYTPGHGPRRHLGIAVSVDALQAILADQQLPRGWYGSLLDRNGVVIARNVDAQRYVGRRASPDVLEALRSHQEGVLETRAFDGTRVVMAYKRSPLTGWTLVVGMPRDEARDALVRSLTLTAALVLLLLTFGAGLVVWAARGIGGAIETLSHSAAEVGRGGPAPPADTGLRETDAVAGALAAASARLQAREEDLHRLNETLESRVVERTRELEEATERLAQARKVEALGRLTGGVAHDFNNLLTAVIGSLDLLGRRITDEALRKYVDVARQAAERGARLTAQLLAFGRRQRLAPEPLDVNAVVESAAALLGSALGATVSVRARLAADPPWAMADRTQLELVVMNLAINARDAMPEGGEVLIETGRRTVTKPSDAVEAPPPGDYVVVSVVDRGTGMAPEVLAHIWEPFFTTKPLGAGSGLGLPQVLGVAKQLGGGVEVQTRLGEGARVSVFLPVAAAPVPTSPEAEAAAPPQADLAGVRVLVVDDDPEVRQVTGALLRDLGCEAEDAPDGPAALARLAAGPAPDVVVMDYAMPGMTGVEAARRMAEAGVASPVVLASGYMDAEGLARSWTGPVLTKPFSKETLTARLLAALRAQRA